MSLVYQQWLLPSLALLFAIYSDWKELVKFGLEMQPRVQNSFIVALVQNMEAASSGIHIGLV